MEDLVLQKDEVKIAKVKQLPNRLIGWTIGGVVVQILLLGYYILAYVEEEKLFNILMIVFICLLAVVLTYKIFDLSKKYQVNSYVITNKRIYVEEFLFFRRKKSSISFSQIKDIQIYNTDLFKTYNIEVYTKKKNMTMKDMTNKDISVLIETVSKSDMELIMNVINKYVK